MPSSVQLCAVLIVVAILATCSAATDCDHSDSATLCHGVRVARSVANMRPVRIVDGVELVRVAPTGNATGRQSAAASTGIGYVDRVLQYLQAHEIKISVHDLVQRSGLVEVVGRAWKEVEAENEVVEARKKDKGGLSTVLITALMMKKMLAALGMGAIAALAAKALGVALLALLLSSLLGLKKLTEPSHDVQYVHGGDHHRRRRREVDEEVPLPYRGWAPNAKH